MAVALSALPSAVVAKDVARPAASAAPRYVHAPDLVKTVTPFLSKQGYMDPDFTATLIKPSPYMGDFFGMQAIGDVSAAEIRRDFVPARASLVASDAHSLTLRFPKGYTATFYPRSAIDVKGAVVNISHVAISGDGWRAIKANVADFVATVERAGLGKRYLLPNPLYKAEVEVAAQLHGGHTASVTVDPSLATFDRSPDAVLLMPEGVHGSSKDAESLIGTLSSHKIDWLSFEMMPVGTQRDLDAFNAAKTGTPAYKAARAKLVTYFAENWNGRAGPKTTGEENYYFKLVEAAHAAGTRVYGVEGSDLPYVVFRYGETAFGASVRSLLWVRNSPKTGHGVIFGGSAHFKEPVGGRVQDLVARLRPRTKVFSLTDLAVPAR